MKIDVEALKSAVDLPSLVGHYTAVKKQGAEYVAKCVAHSPDNHPSMWIAPAKGLIHCFSCGFSADAISFLQTVEGVDFQEACRRLGATAAWEPRVPIAQAAAPLPERITSKPPADAPAPDMRIRALGEPVKVWTYRDTDGGILGYVARYETPEGKQIRCWTWGARGAADPAWGCGHWNHPRHPYGLNRLATRPDSPVLVTEGEKAADAAQALLPAYVAVTWPGGSQSWHRANWAPLAGRNVLLWPDNDAPGVECMNKLAAILADPNGFACKVRIINPAGMADGFDAADWTGTTEELIAWAKPRADWYKQNPAPPVAAPPDTASESSPPIDEPAGAGPAPEAQEEPPPLDPAELPPAPEDAPSEPQRKPRQRPRLAVVDGNAALAPEPESESLPVSMSEDAIADAFAEELQTDWRYVRQWEEWLHWDGDGWQRDRKELIDRLAVEMCRRAVTWQEAASLTADAKRRVNSKRTAGNVRDMARHDRRIAASAEGWDADPLLVGIPGGVFDVRAGKVILGEREQYITLRTAVAPATGKPALWLEHMRRMMDGDDAMINFLQSYAGYCATGDTREQCFLFLYGMGQTGKGTFLLTLAELLGSYAAMSAASTFMHSDRDKHSSEIARLSGCRLVVIDETDGSTRWNEERLKRMTGGGKITAARKYRDEEDIRVTWKLAFAGNHKPALRGVGKEMERRIRLVKCNASIPDEAVDRQFRARMIAQEGPQILNWIFEGAVAWHDGGLPLPEGVSDATRDYLTSEDVIGDWLAERCEEGDGSVDRPAAYRNFSAWMEKRGDRGWSNRAWWSALEDRGFSVRKSSGERRIVGLTLKVTPPDEPPAGRYPD